MRESRTIPRKVEIRCPQLQRREGVGEYIMPIIKEQDKFVIYVVTLSSVKRYMSIEFIGGSCGFIIAQKALQSDLLGMIGSIIAPMAIRRVLQWQQYKFESPMRFGLRALNKPSELNTT